MYDGYGIYWILLTLFFFSALQVWDEVLKRGGKVNGREFFSCDLTVCVCCVSEAVKFLKLLKVDPPTSIRAVKLKI